MGFNDFFKDFGPALHLGETSPLLPRCSSNVLEKNSVILLQTGTKDRQIREGTGKKMDRGRRAMPVQNKPCYERHIQKCQDTHKQRLAKIKPRVDCHAPSSMRTFSKTNAKKHQIMEDRYTEIERDNRLLLEKMSQIMRKGGIAHNNDSAKYAKSLNREARKKRLQQITRENQRILHAIQQADPFYDHVKWAEEAQKNEAYMRNICQLPQALHPTRFEDTNTNIGGGAYKDDDSR